MDFDAEEFLRRPTTALGRLGERKDLLGQFRFRLFPSRLWLRGKQSGFARLLHQLLDAEQRGEMFGNAVQSGRSGVSGALLFCPLDLLPVRRDFVHGFDFRFAEDVRMSAYQFVRDVPRHLVEVEGAAFLRQLTVEDDFTSLPLFWAGDFAGGPTFSGFAGADEELLTGANIFATLASR